MSTAAYALDVTVAWLGLVGWSTVTLCLGAIALQLVQQRRRRR